MEIAEPQVAVELFADKSITHARLIANPGGQALNSTQFSLPTDIIAAIGPEGGFTAAELAAATAAGWQTVSLGNRVLRVETAAIAIAAWTANR